MATPTMIDCPTCRHRISVSAVSCPSCGAVLRKPRRGIFGKIIIVAFWGFNIFMGAGILIGMQRAAETSQGLTGAEAAGAAIGTGLGVSMLLFIWLIGSILLGLMAILTRPR